MIIKTFFACIILSFLFLTCSKEESGVNSIVEDKITFNGISERDPTGVPVREADPDDWNFKDTWAAQELALFGKGYGSDCMLPEAYNIMAYPNPIIDKVVIDAGKPESVRLAIRVVDRNFKVLLALDSIYSKSTMLDFSKFGIQDTVRVYYKYIDNSCEYRGHGDILIKK